MVHFRAILNSGGTWRPKADWEWGVGGRSLPMEGILYIGVRGCPKRDISSLGVMGWGWEAAGNSSVVATMGGRVGWGGVGG